MMFNFKKIQNILITFLGILSFVFVTRFFKISPILGSHFSFFSIADLSIPVVASFSFSASLISLIMRIMWRIIILKAPLNIMVSHLPSFFAASYWSISQSHQIKARFFAAFVTLGCMVAFILHPIGNGAAVYTIYWTIPIILLLVPDTASSFVKVLVHSITSTFVAHAVGSVIWIYTVPGMSSLEWLSLLPVVPVERFCFAGIMVGVYYLIKLVSYIKCLIFKKEIAQ